MLLMYAVGCTIQFRTFPDTVCPRSSDPFYIVSYYIKWVTTSWHTVSHVLLIWLLGRERENKEGRSWKERENARVGLWHTRIKR